MAFGILRQDRLHFIFTNTFSPAYGWVSLTRHDSQELTVYDVGFRVLGQPTTCTSRAPGRWRHADASFHWMNKSATGAVITYSSCGMYI